MKLEIQTTDMTGAVTEAIKNDDVLLKELLERTLKIEADANVAGDQDQESIISDAIGTAIILDNGEETGSAEYVMEVYDAGKEPFKGAGTGFFAGGRYYRMSEEGKTWRNLRLKKRSAKSVLSDLAEPDAGTLERHLRACEEAPKSEPEKETVILADGTAVSWESVYGGSAGAGKTGAMFAAVTGASMENLADALADVPSGLSRSDVPHLVIHDHPVVPGEGCSCASKVSSGGPVEIDGQDVRTEPLPHVDLERRPSQDKPPRPTLDVAIERYGNLTKEVDAFLIRLDSWRVSCDEEDGAFSPQEAHDMAMEAITDSWKALGEHLRELESRGATVRVTSRSRRDAWMRPGAEVALAPASLKAAGAFYSLDVLEHLVIKAVGETHVFLVSGDRDIGAYPKSQVEKRVKRTRARRKAAT